MKIVEFENNQPNEEMESISNIYFNIGKFFERIFFKFF